jgi:lysophospholipase L1-like esterase
MLNFRASGGTDRSREGRRSGGGASSSAIAGAVLGVATAALASTTLVRIRELRRTAAAHAHDLPRRATVGEGLGEPVRLVVLGDSAARGYGLTEPSSAFSQQIARHVARTVGRCVEVTTLATDGHRTATVLEEQVPQVRGHRPDAIVLGVGVNDVLGRVPLGRLREETRALLSALVDAGDGAVVVFVPCPDLTEAPGLPRPLHLVAGWRCRRVGRAQQSVAADLDIPAAPLPRPDAGMFGDDGFHPGAHGHAVMSRYVADVLVRSAAVARGDADADGT